MSRNNTNTESFNNGGATQFTDLTDCPSTHSPANAYVVTNSTGTAITYDTTPPTGATEFTQLNDCPNFINANQYVVGNSGGTALTFTASAPPQAFTDLTDCPSSYTSKNNYTVKVNSSATGLEFVNIANVPTKLFDGSFTDAPATLAGTSGEILYSNGTTTEFVPYPFIPDKIFTGDYNDVPGNYGVSGQVLTTTGTTTIFQTPVTTFVQLADVDSDFTGQANKVVVVDPTESFLTYTSQSVPTDFVSLTDCPSSYTGSGEFYVKVKSTEDGLEFVEGGTGSETLISLTDNTGGAYSSANTNMSLSVNQAHTGFDYKNNCMLQSGYPRLTHTMIKGYRNYPGMSSGFTYNIDDAYLSRYFYFGCYRTNYGGTAYLNNYWTSQQSTGGSCLYPSQGSDTSLDVWPAYVGINSSHSCGAQFRVPNNLSISSPFANTWYFDVLVNINWRIDLGNIDDNIFCMWVCTENEMTDIINNNDDFTQVQKADYFFVNENGASSNAYPGSISEGHISKTVTLKCGSGSTFPTINVFMSCRRKEDYNVKNEFIVRSYYYINCNYTVLGIRAPKTGVDRESMAQPLPGIFW